MWNEQLAQMERDGRINVVRVEPIFPMTDECRICGCEVVLSVWRPTYGVPMYEDLPVPPEWSGEWGGFTACKDCYDRYERRALPMWTVAQLEHVTGHNNQAHLRERSVAK